MLSTHILIAMLVSLVVALRVWFVRSILKSKQLVKVIKYRNF